MPDSMQTLSQVLNKLVAKGLKEFTLTENGMTVDNERFFNPEDLEIVKVFRFEGVSDPSDMSVIYILQTQDGILGYSMNAYGTYTDKEIGYDNFVRRIPTRDHDEELSFEL